ncbi:MAG: CDP-alcohol phosphatidyltransferase family protein [Solirubrobacteraceae bacterium]
MTSGVSITRADPGADAPARTGATCVLLATVGVAGGAPAALQPWDGGTLLRRAVEQLAGLGVDDLRVLTRPAWEQDVERALDGQAVPLHVSAGPAEDLRAIAAIAGSREGDLVVAHGDIVTHREALAGLLTDPRLSTAALTGRPLPFAPLVRLRRGRIVSAASPYHSVHSPDGAFLGVLKVAARDRAGAAAVAERLAALSTPPIPPAWEDRFDRTARVWRKSFRQAGKRAARRASARGERIAPAPAPAAPDEAMVGLHLEAARQDVASLLLTGIVRQGSEVGVSHLRELYWARPLSREEVTEAAEEIARCDEDRVLLDSAVKPTDGFFTTFFVSPYSRFIARWAARRGFTPNQVTVASMAIGLLAAAAFATGDRWGLVAGAVLLQVSFTTDCVDGQLARYTRSFSKLGAWLDSMFDRTKEYAVFAGLAIGAARAGDDVWLLACCALTLQTVRHLADVSFNDAEHSRNRVEAQRPIEEPADRLAPDDKAPEDGVPTLPRRALVRWRRFERSAAVVWPRKMIAFPIGERFAAISITAALFTPRTTFVVLLSWGGLAAAYTVTGRMLRSIA